MKEFRERRIMILMRAALFVTGGVIGAVGMWQALDVIVLTLPFAVKALCYTASVLFLGGLLCLSALPIRKAFRKVSNSARKRFRSVKAVDAAGIAVGLFTGIAVAFLTEYLLSLFLHVLALRILIDAALGLFAAFLTTIAVSGFVTAEIKEDAGTEIPRGMRGYLLTEFALANPKVIALCGLWLEGSIYVLSRTAEMLATAVESGSCSDGTETAYQNFKALYNAKKIRILEFLTDDYLDAAEQRKLKIITDATDTKTRGTKNPVIVLVIGEM